MASRSVPPTANTLFHPWTKIHFAPPTATSCNTVLVSCKRVIEILPPLLQWVPRPHTPLTGPAAIGGQSEFSRRESGLSMTLSERGSPSQHVWNWLPFVRRDRPRT